MKKSKVETYICAGCSKEYKMGKVCEDCHPESKKLKWSHEDI